MRRVAGLPRNSVSPLFVADGMSFEWPPNPKAPLPGGSPPATVMCQVPRPSSPHRFWAAFLPKVSTDVLAKTATLRGRKTLCFQELRHHFCDLVFRPHRHHRCGTHSPASADGSPLARCFAHSGDRARVNGALA